MALVVNISGTAIAAPVVQNGVLDLRHWNSARTPTIELNGEWNFYWNRLIAPLQFATGEEPSAATFTAPVPGDWKTLLAPRGHRERLPAHGTATYSLTILLPENFSADLAFDPGLLGTSSRIYVISQSAQHLVAELGRVNQIENLTRPEMRPQVVEIATMGDSRIVLAVQVSNFTSLVSGFRQTPSIGLPAYLKANHVRTQMMSFAFLALLVALALALLLMFSGKLYRTSQPALLALTLLGCALGASHSYVFALLDPGGTHFDHDWRIRFEAVALIGMCPAMALLIRRRISARAHTLIVSFCFVGTAAAALFVAMANHANALEGRAYFPLIVAGIAVVLCFNTFNRVTTKPWLRFIWVFGAATLAITTLSESELMLPIGAFPVAQAIGWLVSLCCMSTILVAGTGTASETAELRGPALEREVKARTASLEHRADQALKKSAEAKAAEFEALESEFEAEVAREQLSEEKHKQELFVQNISHELRTPLTLILNPLQIVANDNPEDQNLQMALHNSQRLLRLVNQLLDFQLLSRGTRTIDIRPVDLVSFVQTCSEYFAYSCLQRHIRFKTTIEGVQLEDVIDSADKKVIFVLSEVDALEKVIFNLLSNALKFTPDRGEIELGVQLVDNHARVFVTDTGAGIRKEDQEKIFDAFAQADGSETRDHEGSGLGLAYARRLVESMQGRLEVQSIPDLGSRFWVTLPVCEEPETSGDNSFRVKDWLLADGGYHASQHAQQPTAQAVPTESSKGCVLVVDDLREMRLLVAHSLQKRGYRILEAENGKIGFEMAARHKPDLIVSDWMMPVMSGTDLVNELKSTAGLCAIPVILLTAKSDRKSKEQAVSLGADGFLTKPFDQNELVSTVRNLMKLRSAEREAADAQRKNALSQVAAQLAHELNNPLNFISSGMDNLREHHDEMEGVIKKLLLGTGEEAREVREFFRNRFQSLDGVMADIQTGVLRSGSVVQEIRNLTGVDGGANESIHILDEIKRQFQALKRESGTHFINVKLQHLAAEHGEFVGNPVVFRRTIASVLECCAQWSLQNESPEVAVEIERDQLAGLVIRFGQNGERYDIGRSSKLLEPGQDNIGMDSLRKLTLLKSLWIDHGGNIDSVRMGVSGRHVGFSMTLPQSIPLSAEPSLTQVKK